MANPADGGLLHWLVKLYSFAALVLVALAVSAVVGAYGYFSRNAPPTPDLTSYGKTVPTVSRIHAADGTVLAELADEWREVTPYESIPRPVVEAFLAAEDHAFFSHAGLYLRGIARAAWQNLVTGGWAQGGSTISQQVAKQFLGSEKTLVRKINEAIVARRLEARYSKEAILAVYLNHIFLGSGAYGIKAAAKRYFSKQLDELDLGEIATIAGLAQAPSRDSPLTNLENARKRRDVVLERMARRGLITAAAVEQWKHEPIVLRPYRDVYPSVEPYLTEHVRRSLLAKYGKEVVMRAGLQVETTGLPWLDGVAYENVDFSTRKQDKRQGWRGPEAHLEGAARDTFLERAKALYGDRPLAAGHRYLALVDSVTGQGAHVVVGSRRYWLPLKNMKWAARWSERDATNDRTISAATAALRAQDVIWITPAVTSVRPYSDWTLDEHFNPHWVPGRSLDPAPIEVVLEQTPHPQAALLTFDHQSGYVVAMVGGQDYSRSELNRAVQSCRQPGSTYKPIYYSAALDRGYSFDTMLNDIPKAEVDPTTGEVWVPVNLHGTVDFEVSLEYALIFSKNIPSVDVFSKVGAAEVEKWARRLGFTSPIIADKALALGASCTYVDELARAFALFARNGRWLDLVYVRRILDRSGRVLEDNTAFFDEWLAPTSRLDRLAILAGERQRQAIPARAAFLTTKLLAGVVNHGFSTVLRQTGVPAAGKTGTSSATMDLWFVGFTSRWLSAAWMGDDLRERPLGKNDAAYAVAVPMWSRYMREATTGQKLDEIPWEVPRGIHPGDRGGSRGRSFATPMPLVPPQKTKTPPIPAGMPATAG
ncbi:MAG: transglycosylase domain-containing protein [Pseudomonadota bacterium]